MKYILIMTLIFGDGIGNAGYGGAALAAPEFNNLAACNWAGEQWKKTQVGVDEKTKEVEGVFGSRTLIDTIPVNNDRVKATYFCAPKGEEK